jgi:hypothetical protein
MKKVLALITLVLLTSGCAQTAYWTLTDDMNRVVQSKSFQMTVPDGWVRTTKADTWERIEIDGEPQTILLESMAVTRDGTSLHAITVTRHYTPTAFPVIKKKSRANMLPNEAADLYVSELRKRSGLERLKVLSNKPTKVNGKPAFQLVMQFKNEDGLRIRIVSYGFVDKTGFYTINYRAPYLYYYKRDYKQFTSVVRSFKQLKGANDPPPEMPAWAKLFTL